MSRYRQPWGRLDLGGKRCRLQILDPAATFDVEPQLVAKLGDTLSLSLAAPDEILGAVWRQSTADGPVGVDLRTLARDPVEGPALAANALRLLGGVLSQCLIDARVQPRWIRDVFGVLVLGRLEVDGEVIEDARDWARAGLPPVAKWQAMAAQLRQTFGPLWLRSPYTMRAKVKDYGVPQPKGVPVAVRWADALAKLGVVGSSREMLIEWTPVEMIERVENAAYNAEVERRAYVAAGGAQ